MRPNEPTIFRARCDSAGLTSAREAAGEPTHYLMDGGKLYVSDEAAFLRLYASALQCGEACYVVERRTPVFRLFMDLDWTRASEPDRGVWVQLLRVVVDVVRRARGGSFVAVACIADPKPTTDGVRLGAHVHFPDVLVTQSVALSVRELLLPALSALNLDVDAKSLIDPAVYGGNGLRMKGSMKSTPCDPCRDCGGSGRKVDKRVYVPTILMDEDGALASEADVRALCADWHATLRATSIRSDAAEPDVFRAFGAVRRLSDALHEHVHASLTRAFPVYAAQHLRCPWNVTQVISPAVNDTMRIVHTTCTYCCNKNAHHRSKGNAVYFVVTRDTIKQRCFSHKSTLGAAGDVECRTFASTGQPTPPLLWSMLESGEPPADKPVVMRPRGGVKRSVSRREIGTAEELVDVVL
jgi:hypothetical protein